MDKPYFEIVVKLVDDEKEYGTNIYEQKVNAIDLLEVIRAVNKISREGDLKIEGAKAL